MADRLGLPCVHVEAVEHAIDGAMYSFRLGFCWSSILTQILPYIYDNERLVLSSHSRLRD